MAASNSNLGIAKEAKNDEFYTQYADIQKEINAYLDFNPDVFRGNVTGASGIRALLGVLKAGDIALFVTSGT